MADRFTPKALLQFWDTRPPSRRDVTLTLMHVLGLLSEALPIALSHISAETLEVQMNFWEEFMEFERRYDLTFHAEQIKGAAGLSVPEKVGMQLEEWRGIVEIRVNQLTGEIK